ncbi:MAG: AMP-binding protein [Actinomycetota bacterium]|nr:AMP-binding protein [Actinomycetota bacterium]
MNLAGIIDPHPADAPALVTGSGEVTSYGDLRRAVTALQLELAEAGIKQDDRVAVLSANDPAFVVGYLAIVRAGAVAVPLNIASPPAELQRQLAQVDVAAILVGPGGRRVGGAVESLTGVPVLPVTGTGPVGQQTGPAAPVVPQTGSAPAEPVGQQTGSAPAEPVGQQTGPAPAEPVGQQTGPDPVARRPQDLAALLFTAGTAGSPRAAMLTHGNLLANLDQVQRHPGRAIEASDRVLGVLPLSHIFGLNAVLGGALYVGASVVLLDRFDPGRVLELIGSQGVTILVGTPTLFSALTAAPLAHEDSMASVRFAFSGAAPLSAEVADAWQKRFALPLRQGYGLTEASPVVTTAVMDEPARPSSIGVPLPGLEVRLVDDDGEEALAGDPGEIWVRGPNVFPGYWNDPEATEAALTADGWLRTGDIAVVGDDGELAIVDRAKDLIIVAGFNVYPAEVEEALAEHPGVADVAVIGAADRHRGEVVHAFVVLNQPGAGTTADELRGWCRARLARYKCPTEVTFVPSVPHGVAGKLLRRSLRSPTETPTETETAT